MKSTSQRGRRESPSPRRSDLRGAPASRIPRHASALLAAILALGLFRPALARAQPEVSDQQKIAAEAHYKQGRAFYEAGAHDKAIAEYRAGYELSHWPGFLFNIGLAYQAAGEKRQALAYFRRYLQQDPKGEASDEAAEYVARLSREIEIEEARAAARRAREQQDAEARRQRQREAAETRERAVLAARARSKRRLRIAGLLTAGVGLVSLGVGIKFGLDARRASDEVSAHTEGAWSDSLISRYDQGVRDERRMLLFTGIAAASLIGGAVLYLIGRGEVGESRSGRVTVGPSVGAHRAVLSCTGTF